MSTNLDYEINKELGECYLFMGDFDKAANYYQKAASGNDGHPDPYIGLATIAIQRGDLDEALGLYEMALSIVPNDKAYAGAGIIKMEQGKHEQAMDLFENALLHNPNNAVALNCMVKEGYNLGRLERVIPFIEAGMAANPEKEHLHITLAGCLYSVGRHNDARRHLESALEINPTSTEARELFDHIAAA
jgi:tetratricopeptide (TPR) repeat protein